MSSWATRYAPASTDRVSTHSATRAVAYELVGVDDRNDLEKTIAALYYYASMDPALRVTQDDETKESWSTAWATAPRPAASYVKGKTMCR